MIEGEPVPEKDEAPPSSTSANDSIEKGVQSQDPYNSTEATIKQDEDIAEKQQPKDEFGLPIKKVQRVWRSQDEGPASDGNDTSRAREEIEKPPSTRRLDEETESHGNRVEKSAPTANEASEGQHESVNIDKSPQASDSLPGPSLYKPNKSEAAGLSTTDDVLHGKTGAVSEWSHQALAPQTADVEDKKVDDQWQTMPAYAPYDLYDDDDRLVAREAPESDEEANAYHGLGGAGKGYTRVQNDEDAQSATSMDDNTNYLFKSKGTDLTTEDDDQRDPLAQLQATKDLLTEGQRIAYVGVTRLTMAEMVKELEKWETTRGTKKVIALAAENTRMWSQKMMVRLYSHMDIDSSGKFTQLYRYRDTDVDVCTSEQVMIEQLAEHGVLPSDLTPALMQNARVKNPMADPEESLTSPKLNEKKRKSTDSSLKSPPLPDEKQLSRETSKAFGGEDDAETEPLPAYQEHCNDPMPEVRIPTDLGTSKNIDIDIRWTILCDVFLVLLSDSIYDARSRTLLERVGKYLEVSWIDICRFEKRVTDALEMQEEANKETWDEAEHLENRRKRALKRRYMMMGLATVGGSLVIGLSAGLLAPVIGAGLAAGFSTIGVAGTSGFLAGAGGAAIITSTGVVTGGTIAVRASNRRTGAVTTFEYRPLHNNKRVNLILTVSGWMNGKVDDVRLPFSTVDPVMGDMYSLLWEPEMLQSMGQTINILASEALSQTVQQVLGSTILVALMSALQLPIVLTKLSYLIDNPWTVSMARANAAGLILADSLIDRNLGMRPITLVGFSLGARVIFAALRELSKRGAFGLIENVYLFGSPIVANKDEYMRARSVISGRFVNGFASNDWILGYLFRATSGGIMRVAGLAKVENIPGLENFDVTKLVNGHMAYRAAMPKLLREVGWEVESDEFTEIEDPDPENHEKRQRELIREIEEARKDAEQKPEKKRFGFFKRGKLAEKKAWETYDDRIKEASGDDFSTTAAEGHGVNVLFDIEAIKRELESEAIEVKQLESTMPPMKLNPNSSAAGTETNPYANLRETKSYDGSMAHRLKHPAGLSSQASLPNGTGQKDNPFNQGYDEYNLSEEAVNDKLHAEEPKLSFDAPKASMSPQVHEVTDVPPSTPPQRPSLRTSLSSPVSAAGVDSLDHNIWDDEDDPDFGKEQEVKMTF